MGSTHHTRILLQRAHDNLGILAEAPQLQHAQLAQHVVAQALKKLVVIAGTAAALADRQHCVTSTNTRTPHSARFGLGLP